MFDNLREDWVTYERDLWRQGLWAMAVYRFGRWRYGIRYWIIRAPFSFLYKMLLKFIQIITGIHPCEVIIGRRFRIDQFGRIIVSCGAVFGKHLLMQNGVTIGLRRVGVSGLPNISDSVDVGASAKIKGSIKVVGDDGQSEPSRFFTRLAAQFYRDLAYRRELFASPLTVHHATKTLRSSHPS